MRPGPWILLLSLLVLPNLLVSGCRKKEKRRAPATRSVRDTLEKRVLPHLHRRVPAQLRSQLRFRIVEVGERVLSVIPTGWQSQGSDGVWRPADANLGAHTQMSVGANCDGDCVPKDWKRVATRVELRSLDPTAGWTILKDQALGSERLVVARKGDRIEINLARYKKGADRYYFCRVTLDPPLHPATDVFARACRSLRIRRW